MVLLSLSDKYKAYVFYNNKNCLIENRQETLLLLNEKAPHPDTWYINIGVGKPGHQQQYWRHRKCHAYKSDRKQTQNSVFDVIFGKIYILDSPDNPFVYHG